jgi:DNA-3-methyladenine glycosylase II
MLQFDPELAAKHLGRVDPRMRHLIRRAGPFTLQPQRMQSPFEALARAIVYQQLSGKAAATILGRVRALFPGARGFTPQAVLDMPDESLRACGMSAAKVAALKDLAAKTLEGTVPSLARLRKLDDAEIISRLVQVRGIGQWTVEMLLIFRLGRPDVLPVHDLGVRKGYMLTYETPELPKPMELLALGEHWRPYRSMASWYLWRSLDVKAAGLPSSPLDV